MPKLAQNHILLPLPDLLHPSPGHLPWEYAPTLISISAYGQFLIHGWVNGSYIVVTRSPRGTVFSSVFVYTAELLS